MILANNLRPGDRLPTERALGEQFGVSRTVVREAVRSLAGRNVVETRRGSAPIVAAVPASAVASSMSLYLRGSSDEIPYEKVHEVRVAIEVEVAGHAAARTTHVAVGRLRDLYDHMAELLAAGEDMSAADLEFHREIARTTGNEFFIVVLESIVGSLLHVRETTLELPEAPGLAHTSHGLILEAIAARDVQGARSAMRQHLEQVLKLWHAAVELHRAQREAPAPGADD
jgi:GntR family transcriptional repressor for pyruvate dehydrogenase complex